MQKLITDIHTHSTFSHDGKDSLADMLAVAVEKGVCFYGVSEHYDYDVYLTTGEKCRPIGNEEEYFHTARHLQEDYAGVLNVLVGLEYGYIDDTRADNVYLEVTERYKPDFIVNSIHTLNGLDYFHKKPYYNADGSMRDKDEVYSEYLALIRRSLDAAYPYDIVGHIGYVTRYAPYEDKTLSCATHQAQIDDILQTIIRKGKILEVNSSNKSGVTPYLPQREIIERYFDLGGREISYASDAHHTARVIDKRDEVVKTLKEIGFTYITVPCKGEYIKVEI